MPRRRPSAAREKNVCGRFPLVTSKPRRRRGFDATMGEAGEVKLHDELNKTTLVSCLALVKANRCPKGKIGCSSSCSSRADLGLLHAESVCLPRTVSHDGVERGQNVTEQIGGGSIDFVEFKQRQCVENILNKPDKKKLVSALCLDGGGIRGLVTTQILLAVEERLQPGSTLVDCFDWIAGTSTGAYVAGGLSVGLSVRQMQQIYLRFKDQIFEGWAKPYDAKVLEQFIQKEMGENTTLGDIKKPNLIVTTVKAEKHPVSLKLQRSYRIPNISDAENTSLGYNDPKEEYLWKALRRSSAAPFFFSSADGIYVDGGIISNNPTLDLLTELQTINTVYEYKGLDDRVNLGCVLSLGTGKIPTMPIDNLDFELSSNPYTAAVAMKNLGYMLVDQVTATEGAPVDRARSWCHQNGVAYFRFSTPMQKDIILDTKDDKDLVGLMWDTMEYCYQHAQQLDDLAELLQALKA